LGKGGGGKKDKLFVWGGGFRGQFFRLLEVPIGKIPIRKKQGV